MFQVIFHALDEKQQKNVYYIIYVVKESMKWNEIDGIWAEENEMNKNEMRMVLNRIINGWTKRNGIVEMN